MQPAATIEAMLKQLENQLAAANAAGTKHFVRLEQLLLQSPAGRRLTPAQLMPLLQLLSQKINDAETAALKQKIIQKALGYANKYPGADMEGRVAFMLREIMEADAAEEAERQKKLDQERAQRISETAGKSIAEALKRHGF